MKAAGSMRRNWKGFWLPDKSPGTIPCGMISRTVWPVRERDACPNRNFSPTAEDNDAYQELLRHLNHERLEEFRIRAAEQARTAVEHFKDDFMYKIRSAIKEALQRKEELNRIISRLDFGKDKYQFYIGKNKGPDGRYYDMFMDEALEVNPSDLNIGLDNQLNLFTMEHENHYGAMMNDLISIFIPRRTPRRRNWRKPGATWISMRITGLTFLLICSS